MFLKIAIVDKVLAILVLVIIAGTIVVSFFNMKEIMRTELFMDEPY